MQCYPYLSGCIFNYSTAVLAKNQKGRRQGPSDPPTLLKNLCSYGCDVRSTRLQPSKNFPATPLYGTSSTVQPKNISPGCLCRHFQRRLSVWWISPHCAIWHTMKFASLTLPERVARPENLQDPPWFIFQRANHLEATRICPTFCRWD